MDNKPINEHIPYDTLLVINSDGRNLGEMTKTDALALAEEQELDLILLAPKRENSLAIAKIVNYGKYLYEQKAKSKDNRQKTIKVKEITVKPQIGDHDLTWRGKDALRWIKEGHQVKFRIKAFGRVGYRPELIQEVYDKFLSILGNDAKVITPLKKLSPVLYMATIAKNK